MLYNAIQLLQQCQCGIVVRSQGQKEEAFYRLSFNAAFSCSRESAVYKFRSHNYYVMCVQGILVGKNGGNFIFIFLFSLTDKTGSFFRTNATK